MNIEQLREYCLRKAGTKECFPFDDVTLVFKVGTVEKSKMYALTSLERMPRSVSLKGAPERILDLRERYEAVVPAYHMNKQYWNSIVLDGDTGDALLMKLIDHSYDLVFSSLPKQVQNTIKKTVDEG